MSGPVLALALVLAACTKSDLSSTDGGEQVTPEVTSAAAVEVAVEPPAEPATPAAPESTPTATPAPAPTATPAPVPAELLPLPTPHPGALEPLLIDDEIVQGELDNGLRYLIRNNDTPGDSLSFALVVDAGSALEDDDQIGGAHLLEHMLFNGTELYPGNELVDVLQSFGMAFGADLNAYTSLDETVYRLTVPATRADMTRAVAVLEQWAAHALIDPGDVEAERGVVQAEWRQGYAGLDGRISEFVADMLLGGTFYEDRLPIGTEQSILTMGADDLKRYYDDWYRPDRMTVIAVGDYNLQAIEREIESVFSGLTNRGTTPTGGREPVPARSEVGAYVFVDPEATFTFFEVLFPAPQTPVQTADDYARAVREQAAFEIVRFRLAEQINRGLLPAGSAYTTSRSWVETLSAPAIGVRGRAEDMTVLAAAVLEELERVRRFGFTDIEASQAVDRLTAELQRERDSLSTVQDATMLHELVAYASAGHRSSVAQDRLDTFALILEDLDARALSAQLQHIMVDRPPALLLLGSSEDQDVLPTAEDLDRLYAQSRSVAMTERGPSVAAPDMLMEPLEPVEETSSQMIHGGATELVFENGATVILKPTEIATDSVLVSVVSPGGYSVVDPRDVPAMRVTSAVVGESGVGPHDLATATAILLDDRVWLWPYIDFEQEGLSGGSSATDLDDLMQAIHLMMESPRAESVALANLDAQIRPALESPELSPDYARSFAFSQARYGADTRFGGYTLEALDPSSLDGVAFDRFKERFGDPQDFAFIFVGDVDIPEATDLARRYIGTIEPAFASDGPETVDYSLEPPMPDGVVQRTVVAGQSDQGSLTMLFSKPAPGIEAEDVAVQVLNEAVSMVLLDEVRERLAASYSPSVIIRYSWTSQATFDGHINVQADPKRLDELENVVVGLLSKLATDGIPDDAYASAYEIVEQRYRFVSNETWQAEYSLAFLNDEYEVITPVQRIELLELVNKDSIDELAALLFQTDRYIAVQVVPESN